MGIGSVQIEQIVSSSLGKMEFLEKFGGVGDHCTIKDIIILITRYNEINIFVLQNDI